ncbi:hypothetical protein [Paracoccus sp. (in: a-proteobacteria)]|uniref:hypothetical protein n=1 Tax=Paracoccus sp. TaxID=267 RepID=UPI0026E00EFA|nr:hypothetical protein [Paracoccus sp. (in: a-proteobacteria)]MDO5648395.1 hypothetical protein [Paracoccus sp. (in: a-proteobacteria)]
MGPELVLMAALAGEPDPLTAFTNDATEWLLAGESLPRDYRLRLLAMDPADRIQAIVFLRRAGLLTDRAWPLDDLLRDTPAPTENREK